MKKFLTLFAVTVAFCISGFAQRKAIPNPCLSKDPKVRATSKKPCPSAPAPKKNTPPKLPKSTDGDGTSDDNDDSNDSPDDNTGKKQNPPPKNKKPKEPEDNGAMFFITIESDGGKTEIAYTQFESRGGQASMENEQSSHMSFFYGASNYTNNDDNFTFIGRIPAAAKGSYSQGEDGFNFSFETTRFPKHRILLCASANYDITAMPQPEGIVAKPTKFVEGTFTCTGESYEDDSDKKIQYTMTGRFKLPRIS